jgi:hypothetical protein|tara:strand:+ start:65 stop:673 length:609 start_codon:yes stop_codon:yes gene_type:complete
MSQNKNQQSLLNKNRVDKFILVFQLPPALRKIKKRNNRDTFNVDEDAFQMSVYGAVVPEITVAAIQIPYAGSNLYNSSHAKEPFPPVDINFTVDNEFNNYWTIYKWLDLMHDDKTGLFDDDDLVDNELTDGQVPGPFAFSDYQTDLTLYGLDEFNNKRIEFTYTNAFPVTVGSINYNYRDANEIESSATFVYSQIRTKLLNI